MGYFTGARCDICGREIIWKGIVNKKWVEKWSREEGWSFGKLIKCPSCKAQKRVKN